jgi:DNA processing protein
VGGTPRQGSLRLQARLLGTRGQAILCPGDPERPAQPDELADARPLALRLRGRADLRFACLRSVSVAGARPAAAYGTHVATKMAAALAERG